jgi:hypothetical protein
LRKAELFSEIHVKFSSVIFVTNWYHIPTSPQTYPKVIMKNNKNILSHLQMFTILGAQLYIEGNLYL